jgi:hypothetical protein
MPGCCLPSLTAATTLQFTTGGLQLSLEQDPTHHRGDHLGVKKTPRSLKYLILLK